MLMCEVHRCVSHYNEIIALTQIALIISGKPCQLCAKSTSEDVLNKLMKLQSRSQQREQKPLEEHICK